MAKEYKNILLKISGEILAAETNNTFDNLDYLLKNEVKSLKGVLEIVK